MAKSTRAPKRAPGIGVVRGLKKGFTVTKRPITAVETKADDKTFVYTNAKSKRNRSHKKLWAIRSVIADVVGTLPYERRAQEMLKVGREKRALKFVKRRLGSFQAAKVKREKLTELLRTKKK